MVSSLRRGKQLNLICRGKSTTQAENGSDTKQSMFVFLFFFSSLPFCVLFFLLAWVAALWGLYLGGGIYCTKVNNWEFGGLKGQVLGLQRRGWGLFFSMLVVKDNKKYFMMTDHAFDECMFRGLKTFTCWKQDKYPILTLLSKHWQLFPVPTVSQAFAIKTMKIKVVGINQISMLQAECVQKDIFQPKYGTTKLNIHVVAS